MSLDARYILKYDCQSYLSPTPMELDKKFLFEKYGGEFMEIGWEYDLFWEKPKYTLLAEEIKKLHADQILEYRDCDKWRDITPNAQR
jgi:hypothetical protein